MKSLRDEWQENKDCGEADDFEMAGPNMMDNVLIDQTENTGGESHKVDDMEPHVC